MRRFKKIIFLFETNLNALVIETHVVTNIDCSCFYSCKEYVKFDFENLQLVSKAAKMTLIKRNHKYDLNTFVKKRNNNLNFLE